MAMEQFIEPIEREDGVCQSKLARTTWDQDLVRG